MKLVLALIAAAFAGFTSAADPPVPSHLVFPASTPLHEILFGDEDVFVAVNGKAKLDSDALRKELKPLAGEGKRVQFQVVVEHSTPDEKEIAERLHKELALIAKEAGFAKSRRSTSYIGRFDWVADTAVARKAIAEKRTGDETGRGDGGVRVYPVRTPLSVHLSKDSQVVADISPEAMKDLVKLEERVRALMKAQGLEPKGRIRFITRVRGDEQVPDARYERMKSLGKALEFEESTTTTSYE
ncbi:MAG: hypothetical protein WBC44_13150 [Planctomycetaceae bacterium]